MLELLIGIFPIKAVIGRSTNKSPPTIIFALPERTEGVMIKENISKEADQKYAKEATETHGPVSQIKKENKSQSNDKPKLDRRETGGEIEEPRNGFG